MGGYPMRCPFCGHENEDADVKECVVCSFPFSGNVKPVRIGIGKRLPKLKEPQRCPDCGSIDINEADCPVCGYTFSASEKKFIHAPSESSPDS
jgi:ribosomal protein L37E